MATPGQAQALVIAAVGLGLYSRGVPQKLWAAVWSGRGSTFGSAIPAAPVSDNGNVSPAPGSDTGSWDTGPVTAGAEVDPARLSAAENAVTATRPMEQWLDWCLQWTDDVRSRLGLKTWYGLGNAQAACNSSQLRQGGAPLGAAICFNNNHIGISNGNGTYTSAGLPGGVQTLSYLGNPAYSGWTP